VAEDWLEQYLTLTEGLPTPTLFRLWSGIGALSAVLERKVWFDSALEVTYPNLFILFVAQPGVGKTQAIKPARRLLAASRAVIMAPTDMTKAAFIDVLAASKKRVMYNGRTLEYNPLAIVLTEFGTLINAHDLEFMSVFCDAFDHEPIASQRRGHNSGKEIAIKHPCISILAGCAPHYLSELLPESAWHMGFTARLIMVYSTDKVRMSLFTQRDDRTALEATLIAGLAQRGKLLGPVTFSEGAKALLETWGSAGIPPVPGHMRLAHYRTRREVYLLKLAMIASVSRDTALQVTSEDCERAKSWLLGAESMMPDIFRDMSQKNDSVLMNEVHRYAWNAWVASSPRDISRRAPLHKTELMRFLQLRCPIIVAEKILDGMVKADWFAVDAVNAFHYTPRPRSFTGGGDLQ
jgi:hypothetical protein